MQGRENTGYSVQFGVICLKVTQGETNDRQTVLHIEVDSALVEQHMGRAHQRVAARVNVPGFRKGKAPRRVVESFVGKEYLLEEALESLIPAAVSAAVEQEGLKASATPRVSVVERDPVVKIDATIPLPPVATLGEYASIRFDDEIEQVTDEQVEESVQRLTEANASWNDVDRPVKAGDLITFTSRGTADDNTFMDQTDAEYLADADNPNPVPGFSAALVGIKPGESKSFSIEVPEDFSRAELAGKTAEFEVTVASVREKSLPELTDELVKGLGEGINTVADLRIRIRENLEARATQALRESLEQKVVDELVERSTFELSPIMLEHEAEHILREQEQALARYNISFDQYLAQTGQSADELVANATQTAERRVKRTLVMDKLAESEALEPTDAEIDAEIESLNAEHAGHDHEQTDYSSDEARQSVAAVLKRRKAVDRALEIAQTKDDTAKSATKKATSKRKKQVDAAEASDDSVKAESDEPDVVEASNE